MVIVINNTIQTKPLESPAELFTEFPNFVQKAKEFVSIEIKLIGSLESLIYVNQREMAIVNTIKDRNIRIVGSDDATTCILVVIRDKISGSIALAHLDGAGMEDAVEEMLGALRPDTESLDGFELSLIGAYDDPQNIAKQVFSVLMLAFHKSKYKLDLQLAVVGLLNTTKRGDILYPIVYGIALDTDSCAIYPATFPENLRGPDQNLRHSRTFLGHSKVMEIYNSNTGLLCFEPFFCEPIIITDILLSLNDKSLLKHLSTSPDAEPPHFVSQTRDTLRFLKENPDIPLMCFPDNQPRRYQYNNKDACWSRVK